MSLRSFMVAFALFLAGTAAPAAGQGTLYFYCYAPDPASGTVFMSQAQPVGPVSERAGYGAAYVAYLRSTGRVGSDVQGYCTMRSSEREIARAQAALPRESCPECAGAKRFEGVAWPRAEGRTLAAPAAVTVAENIAKPAPRSETPQLTNTTPSHDPLIVILGNEETGKLIKLSNGPDLLEAAQKQARTIRSTGWKTLLVSRAPGFGASVCVESGGQFRFFIAHGLASQREAVGEARAAAKSYSSRSGGTEKICGAPWRAGHEPIEQEDQTATDVVKDFIREQSTCDTTLPEVVDEKAARLHAAPDGRLPCVQRTSTGTGVRG